MSTAGCSLSPSPSGQIATALAWRNSMPWRRYTGASGNVTSSGDIRPTPTQMFDGIQFQSEFGDTTTTSWPLPSNRRRCRAAVCPEIPAPRITTRAMTCPLSAVRRLDVEPALQHTPWGITVEIF